MTDKKTVAVFTSHADYINTGGKNVWLGLFLKQAGYDVMMLCWDEPNAQNFAAHKLPHVRLTIEEKTGDLHASAMELDKLLDTPIVEHSTIPAPTLGRLIAFDDFLGCARIWSLNGEGAIRFDCLVSTMLPAEFTVGEDAIMGLQLWRYATHHRIPHIGVECSPLDNDTRLQQWPVDMLLTKGDPREEPTYSPFILDPRKIDMRDLEDIGPGRIIRVADESSHFSLTSPKAIRKELKKIKTAERELARMEVAEQKINQHSWPTRKIYKDIAPEVFQMDRATRYSLSLSAEPLLEELYRNHRTALVAQLGVHGSRYLYLPFHLSYKERAIELLENLAPYRDDLMAAGFALIISCDSRQFRRTLTEMDMVNIGLLRWLAPWRVGDHKRFAVVEGPPILWLMDMAQIILAPCESLATEWARQWGVPVIRPGEEARIADLSLGTSVVEAVQWMLDPARETQEEAA